MDNKEVILTFKNNIQGEKKLQEYEKRLQNIYSMLGSLEKGQTTAIQPMTKEAKKLNKEVDISTKSVKNLGNQFNLAFNTIKIGAFLKSLYSASKSMFNLVSASSQYIENVNLLEVAYAKIGEGTTDYNKAVEESSKSVKELINQMSYVYGFDESRLTRSFGIFRQMANAMKLPTETAEDLSEHLVKMSNDIASLYNLDLSRAENALQSALSGQVRPIRSATGADITEKTLQTTVDDLGLDRSISQLSYVEKRLIMIISLTNQLKNSQGDYGRTIESVSNQIRVMHEQWDRVTRAVGNIFYPVLKKILPVMNAILMVVTEIANRIAKFVAGLLGVDLEEQFDYSNLAGTADATSDLIDGMDGVADSANGAGKAIDKFKEKLSGLRGFDKLNVITSPKDTDTNGIGGVSGGGAGGIDSGILDEFNKKMKEYDDNMKKIKMRATEIYEAIMKWIDLPLGEKIKTAYEWWSKLSIPMKVIAGLGLGLIFVNIYRALSGIAKLTGLTQLFTGIAKGGSIIAGSGLIGTLLLIGTAIGIVAYSLYDLYQKNEEFATEVNEMWLGIQEAIQPVVEHLQELWDNLKILFDETLKPMFTEFYEIIQELSRVLLEILYPVFRDVIIPVLDLFIRIINDIIDIINKMWKEYGEPISKLIKETIKSIGDIFNNLWNTILKPIIDNLMKRINDLWDNTLRPMFEKVMGIIGKLIELILTLWNKWLKPIVDWIINKFGPPIVAIVNTIADVFHTAFKFIGGIINGLLDILGGVIDFLTGVFSLNFGKALDGLVGILKGVANIFISIFEGIVNIGIDILNFFIRGIYSAMKGVVNGIGGLIETIAKTVGIDVNLKIKGNGPEIPKANFPRLEKGMDFVPKDFYGPVYLDYGERVLTKQENRDYSMNNGNNSFGMSNGTNMTQPMNATFVIQVGSKEVARQVITDLQGMAKSNGKPITIG